MRLRSLLANPATSPAFKPYGKARWGAPARSAIIAILAAGLAASSCARKPKSTSSGAGAPTQQFPKLILTPETGLSGHVVRVNANGRFAILNFPVGHLPSIEQRLNVYRLGLKTGEILVTGPQLDDNIVGDVVAGDVQPGDEVRDR